MIANPKWFMRRKYGGWGFHPKTWQGYVFLGFLVLPLIIFHIIPIWNEFTRIVVTCVWLLLVFFESIDIMTNLDKDEMEERIEALSERNTAWAMVIIITIGILYQLISSALNESIKVDLFLVAALFAGVIVKSVSNIYYQKRGI